MQPVLLVLQKLKNYIGDIDVYSIRLHQVLNINLVTTCKIIGLAKGKFSRLKKGFEHNIYLTQRRGNQSEKNYHCRFIVRLFCYL